MKKWDLDTPVLLLDLDVLERNIEAMADFARQAGCALRPHFKVHRTPPICHRQLAAGAVGITCAKLGEAEVLIRHGIRDILLAYEVAGPQKIKRLVELSPLANLIACVDDPDVARQIAAAARAAGTDVNLLVEMDVGLGRCGVASVAEAVELARLIAAEDGLRFRGLTGYEGQLILEPPGPEKEQKVRAALDPLRQAKEQLESEGLAVEIVSAGGTGTYHITGTLDYVTELQVGTYALNDLMFRGVGAPFGFAMTVLTTVMSRRADRLITDAGMKALHPLLGSPQAKDHPELGPPSLSAEHGTFALEGDTSLRPGDKLEVIPFYSDGTINLYHEWIVVRGDEVVDTWPIAAHGKSK